MNLTRPRLWLAVDITVALAAGGTGIAVAAAGSPSGTRSAANAPTQASTSTPASPTTAAKSAIFTDTCRLTQVAAIDPLLMPGMTGMSMEHDSSATRPSPQPRLPVRSAAG